MAPRKMTKPEKQWVCGFGVALAEVNRKWDMPTNIAEVVREAGLSAGDFVRAGLDVYDRREIANCVKAATIPDPDKVTFDDVLKAMPLGDSITAQKLAHELCPGLEGLAKSHGGPGRGAVKVSYLLGRLKKKQLVGSHFPADGSSTTWRLTSWGIQKRLYGR